VKRTIQLFHEVSGAREYSVADENVTVKDFAFSVVEELRDQDKEFFEVYATDGARIGDRKVADALDPYIVVCDIISARGQIANESGAALRIGPDFSSRLRGYLESFDNVETCGFLLGLRRDDAPEYMLGVFPELDMQTRNDAVVGSLDVALILLGARNIQLAEGRLSLAWIHTHLDTPPRLSVQDKGTLARLRSLAPETCAMIFNRRFASLGIVSYRSDGTRLPLLQVAPDSAAGLFVDAVQRSIALLYRTNGRKPPRFVT
jgi:hypothetical protein